MVINGGLINLGATSRLTIYFFLNPCLITLPACFINNFINGEF
jgi:hypothetical protein